MTTNSHDSDWQQEWQEWTHPDSLESEQARQDLNPPPSLNDDYRGAASYDVPTGSYYPWSSEASNTPNDDWGATGPCRWSEDTQEAAGYFYGNDGGTASLEEMSATDQGVVTTPLEAADDSSRVGSKMNESGGKDGSDAMDFDGGLSSWEVAGGESWTYNEYGQRVWRDWVEYFDESAQAAYFYNTVTGEVRAALVLFTTRVRKHLIENLMQTFMRVIADNIARLHQSEQKYTEVYGTPFPFKMYFVEVEI